jgi:hypothetical protein
MVFPARVAGHRAHRLGARRRRTGGAEGRSPAAAGGRADGARPRPGGPGPSGPLGIASSRMGHLRDALCCAYDALGFPQATGDDEVFRQLVLARIIEPASKQDSLRVPEEARAAAPSYPTLNRRLPVWAEEPWRQALSEAKPRQRRCCRSSRSSWPPPAAGRHGGRGRGHDLGGQPDGHRGRGLSFMLGMKILTSPAKSRSGAGSTPAEDIPDGHVFTQPGSAGPARSGVTSGSTTSSRPTGHGAPCAGSTSRSPRPRRPSPGWPR